MADPSVGDDIAVAGILANLLALPQSIPQEYQQAQQQRAQLTQMAPGLGIKPEEVNQMAPLPAMQQFPGTQVPVLGSVLRGIGTTGQMLQRVLGTAPAPRPPMQQLMEYATLRKTGAETSKAEAETRRIERGDDTGKKPWLYSGMTPEEARKSKETSTGVGKQPWEDQGLTPEEARKAKVTTAVEKARGVAGVKDATLTNTTKTMREAAPKVLHFVDRIEQQLQTLQTGPLASRYQELLAGKGGVANPEFTAYRTDVGLLQTLLLRMHVGARGGNQMMEHFKGLIDAGIQSPENMRAALEEIRSYATDVASTPGIAPTPGVDPATEDTSDRPTGLTPEDTQALQAIHAGPGTREEKVAKMRQYMTEHGIMPNAPVDIAR